MDIGTSPGEVRGAGSIQKATKKQDPQETLPAASQELPQEVPDQAPPETTQEPPVEKSPTVADPPPPAPSKLPEFDTNRVADALKDSKELDGGRYVARTTGASAMDNKLATDPIGLTQLEDPKQKDMFELHGFKVQYTIPGTKDIASASVRVFFKSMNQIRNAISWNTYRHTMANGLILETTITEGLPLVACNDAIKYQYTVDKKWRKGV